MCVCVCVLGCCIGLPIFIRQNRKNTDTEQDQRKHHINTNASRNSAHTRKPRYTLNVAYAICVCVCVCIRHRPKVDLQSPYRRRKCQRMQFLQRMRELYGSEKKIRETDNSNKQGQEEETKSRAYDISTRKCKELYEPTKSSSINTHVNIERET